jgi:membrane associated rhomboid family serine protease
LAFIPLYDTNPLRNIKRPWVAWAIIAANIVIYFAVEGGSFSKEPGDEVTTAFGLVPAYLDGVAQRPIEVAAVPDALTLVTYSFLHGSFWHLAGNMIFLWVFADNVEDALGHFRYLIFYVLCAVAAGFAFVLSAPMSEAPVIGASGAIAGNIGAYLLLHPRAKIWVLIVIPVRIRAVYALGFWIIFQFFSAVEQSSDQEVAWWAHIGGFAIGALLVIFMRQKGVPLFAPAPNEATPRRSAAATAVDGAPPFMPPPIAPAEPPPGPPWEAPGGERNSDYPKGPWG